MASSKLFRTAITADSTTAQEQLGSVRKEYDSTNGFRTFKYVQASLTVAASNGRVLCWYDTIGTVATDDISTTRASLPAGVAIGTLTHGRYGWVQMGGYHSAVDTNGDDDVADGDVVVVDTATDGVADSVAYGAASSLKILGIAVAADVDASDTVAVLLDCGYGDIVK